MNPLSNEKAAVAAFWNRAACGEELYLKGDEKAAYLNQSRVRYELEPYICDFADFKGSRGKRVLEVGVGLGADHQRFAEEGADLFGWDLTSRAIEHTSKRFGLFGLASSLQQADAESLPYTSNFFDRVYSWGVLHHSPDTAKAVQEVYRVLKPGGLAQIMIYHRYSFVGYMLWVRYALLRLRPFTALDWIYSRYLESPGTKAYGIRDARILFRQFATITIKTILTHGDLLTSSAGQRHQGALLNLARKIWPRSLIGKCFSRHGLFMLIHAVK